MLSNQQMMLLALGALGGYLFYANRKREETASFVGQAELGQYVRCGAGISEESCRETCKNVGATYESVWGQSGLIQGCRYGAGMVANPNTGRNRKKLLSSVRNATR